MCQKGMMHVWLSRAIFLRREQEKILESAKALGRPSDRARKEAAAVRVRPDLTAAGRVAPTPITAERRRDGRTDGRTQSRLYVNYCNFATRTLARSLSVSPTHSHSHVRPLHRLFFYYFLSGASMEDVCAHGERRLPESRQCKGGCVSSIV